MAKKALITGLTGQDGSYLAELLVAKGYEVFGLVRRTSTDPFERFKTIPDVFGKVKKIFGNLHDNTSIVKALEIAQPDEVYNLAAQSDVAVSFVCPEETRDVNYNGVKRVFDAALKVNPAVRMYQASTSEMFGSTNPPQNEDSPFSPVSPYAVAKNDAHRDFVLGYRKQMNAFATSGFLFNHESPRRGLNFVTRKVTHGLSKVKLGLIDHIELGNMDSKRDWGYAGDYVEVMWMLLQQEKPDDFVIATGESRTVREFVEAACRALDIEAAWQGEGLEEKLIEKKTGKAIVTINPEFFRPREVDYLLGDASKAARVLGWKPKTSFDQLVAMMAKSDYDSLCGK